VLPGLAALGRAAEAVGRAWAPWAYGQWPTAQWLEAWEQLVQEAQGLHAHQYGGYRPVAWDRVGCLPPRRPGGPATPAAAQAFPATPRAIAARVGTVGPPRLAVPGRLVRGEPTAPSDTACQLRL